MNGSYVDGEWLRHGDVIVNTSPSDDRDIIGEYACATRDDVAHAVSAASLAFGHWRDRSPEDRAVILDASGDAILHRRKELGEILSREEGKALAEGIGEVVRAGRIFKFFAAEAVRLTGAFGASIRPGVDIETRREALGVVGVITPWNFPIAIPAWKIAPALAFGNTVVFKPSEMTPASACMLIEILGEAGLPRGVLNLLVGKGGDMGGSLVEGREVRAISFTGSVATGRQVGLAAMEGGKKVQMEMGGSNPLVIADDADLDIAVEVAVNGAFYSTGQRCTASRRIIVDAHIHDDFVEKVIQRMAMLKVGHALESGTDIGPVATERQLSTNLDYLRSGAAEGAELISGGQVLDRPTKGHFLSPALFVNARNDMRICREEVFGPIAAVIRANDYDEAIAIANDTAFGLSAGICTRSLKRASDFKARAVAGMVMVNLPTAGVDYHVPFGGYKASSYGSREQDEHTPDFYTNVKTTYTYG